MRVVIHPATSVDIAHVAHNLRADDRRELETASGLHAGIALAHSWAVSDLTFVAHVDGEPAVVFGVAKGIIWLVGTDAISSAALPIFRLSKKFVRAFLQMYPILYNKADCRNTLHIRWLRLLGFKFTEFEMVHGHPFHRFHMHREGYFQCATP